jgi:hypothetical protein
MCRSALRTTPLRLPPAYRRRQSSLHGRCAPFARIAILFLGLSSRSLDTSSSSIRQASTVPSSLALSLNEQKSGRLLGVEAKTDSLSYHPAANPMGSTEQKLGARNSAEPRLPCFCLSAPLIRPCLRDFSFWSDAVGRLLLRRKLLPTPSLATTMQSKMVVNLFLIAVRCSGSFARPDGWTHGKAYPRTTLAILFVPGARYPALRSPYPSLPWSSIEIGRSARGDFQRKGSAYVQISAASRKSNRVRRTRQGFDQR